MVLDGRAAGLREKWRADVPVLYDFFVNHHTTWPSLPCRWGSVQVEHATYAEQQVFLSEQTDGSAPNTLLIANVAVPYAHQTRPEHLLEEWEEDAASELVAVAKTIYHPGEVNRIRELPQHPYIVATHTDAPEILIWNTETQPDRREVSEDGGDSDDPSSPDLVLTGHEDNAEFALATSQEGSFLLSGGRDTHVALWCLEDSVVQGATSLDESGDSPTIPTRGLFKGHKDTVEDVQFKPNSFDEFCSVGDDHCLLFWDAREGRAPVVRVERAHKKDVHCVDWCPQDEHYVITGSADCTARLFDRRKMGTQGGQSAAVHTFSGLHKDAVIQVQWCPHTEGVFASAGEDGLINIVSAKGVMQAEGAKRPKDGPADVRLQHWGHRDKLSDIHWNPHVPWTLLSSSIDAGKGGGGTLQVWRPAELLQSSKEAGVSQLESWQELATVRTTRRAHT